MQLMLMQLHETTTKIKKRRFIAVISIRGRIYNSLGILSILKSTSLPHLCNVIKTHY